MTTILICLNKSIVTMCLLRFVVPLSLFCFFSFLLLDTTTTTTTTTTTRKSYIYMHSLRQAITWHRYVATWLPSHSVWFNVIQWTNDFWLEFLLAWINITSAHSVVHKKYRLESTGLREHITSIFVHSTRRSCKQYTNVWTDAIHPQFGRARHWAR